MRNIQIIPQVISNKKNISIVLVVDVISAPNINRIAQPFETI